MCMYAEIQRDKRMADKLVYIPNDDTQNCHLSRLKFVVVTLDTQFN